MKGRALSVRELCAILDPLLDYAAVRKSSHSISEELFRTALRLAGNRDLLGPDDAGLTQRRAEFAAELRDVLQRVERISLLALRRTEAALP